MKDFDSDDIVKDPHYEPGKSASTIDGEGREIQDSLHKNPNLKYQIRTKFSTFFRFKTISRKSYMFFCASTPLSKARIGSKFN